MSEDKAFIEAVSALLRVAVSLARKVGTSNPELREALITLRLCCVELIEAVNENLFAMKPEPPKPASEAVRKAPDLPADLKDLVEVKEVEGGFAIRPKVFMGEKFKDLAMWVKQQGGEWVKEGKYFKIKG